MQKEETGAQGSASTRIEPGYVLIGEPYVLHTLPRSEGGSVTVISDTKDGPPEGVGVSDFNPLCLVSPHLVSASAP